MTPSLLRVPLCLALALAGAARLAAFDKHGPRVEVNYFEPDHFTDVRDGFPNGTDAGREAVLAGLKSHLVRRAQRHVPDGCKLAITITDVDLAGDFEPWHGPRWSDVRVVKDLYPPRLTLTFQVTDAEGKVVKSGKRELTDLAFMMKITMAFRDDPLRHEKALLDDWLGLEFRPAKGG